MKTAVAGLHPARGEGRKPRAAGTNVAQFAVKPAQEPDAGQHIRFDFVTSIWCGATVACIGAVVMPPFPESRS